jgi:hypothetical protein
MRKLIFVLCAVAAFGLAPSALGKGPIELCGSNGCAKLADEAGAAPMIPLGISGPSVQRLDPAAPAPYYRIGFGEGTGRSLAYWIPSSSVLRVVDANGLAAWVAADPDAKAVLDRVAARLTAFAAPTAASALVDRRQASGGATYLDLYTIGTRTLRWPRTVAWVPVTVTDGSSTPWTDGANSLWISRKGGYLRRDGTVARIPAAIADRIRARLALR